MPDHSPDLATGPDPDSGTDPGSGTASGSDTALAERFERHRAHLRAVAVRMLGSPAEADDAVQEAWLRLHRGDHAVVDNLGGWLTTVVSRICLDVLRARRSHPERSLDDLGTDPDAGVPTAAEQPPDPERTALLADAVGPALIVVLDTLEPAERLAFVLHDMFGVPFDEIAPVVGRSPVAARQLASRARRRVRGAAPPASGDVGRRRRVVEAFLAASRDGDFDGLLAVLDPDVVLRADAAAARSGAEPEVRGAEAVAAQFRGRARAARLALVDGVPGAVWSVGGRPRVAFVFTFDGDTVTGIELRAGGLDAMDVVPLPD